MRGPKKVASASHGHGRTPGGPNGGPSAEPISHAEAAILFGLLARERALVLAVSGGPDSTALLWLAARWRDALETPPKLLAITVDHGLRAAAAAEARAVKRLAAQLDLPHRTVRWSGPKPSTGVQEAAREARYRLLEQAARRAGARYVLTAHTQDDQAETVLFRLLRGSGVSGLRGMAIAAPLPFAGAGAGQPVFVCRPMLSVPKVRLIATLDAAGIPYASDPSNADPRFARPRLRALMPQLAAEGLSAERLALLADRIARADIAIEEAVDAALNRLAPGPWPEQGPVTLDAAAFGDLAAEIQLRMLARLIGWVGDEGPVELRKLEALHEALENPLRDLVLTGKSRPFRRTLAGALVTLAGDRLDVALAPARRGTKRVEKPLTSQSHRRRKVAKPR